MDERRYLSDPAFSEPHNGPVRVDGNGVQHGRDPSRRQIRAMATAILKACPRPQVGESWKPVEFPVVSEDTFGMRSVDRF